MLSASAAAGIGHRSGRRPAADASHLRDDRSYARILLGDHDHDAAAVARSPDADAIGVDAGLVLEKRDGRAEVVDLVEVVQVGALELDTRASRSQTARSSVVVSASRSEDSLPLNP